MIFEYFSAHPDVIAAGLSAVATIFAAVATWRAPVSAARIAEKLRRDGDDAHEKMKLKFYVFSTLMQERAAIWSLEAVRALNLIDVVFNDTREVREAWAELFLAFDQKNGVPEHAKEERLRRLLRAIAEDLGLSRGLRLDDFGRIYYPNAIAQEQQIKSLEREAALRKLQGQTSPTANAATQPTPNLWPPRPD